MKALLIALIIILLAGVTAWAQIETPTPTVTPSPTPAPFTDLGAEDGTGTITEKDGKYELVLDGSPDKIEITADASRVGARLYRWGKECWVDVSMPFAALTATAVEDNKVKTADSKIELNLYGTETHGVESFEFEVILKEKPLTNQIVYDIDSQGLRFLYQPPLTQEWASGWNEKLQEAITVTETEVRGSDGRLMLHRPEHIVGSYAVYHATRGRVHESQADATKYRTGKAYHIYRPQLIDAIGTKCWADQVIENGKQTITIPQKFLDTAVYPIRHAAGDTFGYSTGKGGSAVTIEDKISGLLDTCVNGGTGDSITAWFLSSGAGQKVNAAIYDTSYDIVANGITDEESLGSGFDNWQQMDFSGTDPTLSSSTDYWLVVMANTDVEAFYETDSLTFLYQYGNVYENDFPASMTSPNTYNNYIMSIYCTYTPSAPAGAGQFIFINTDW